MSTYVFSLVLIKPELTDAECETLFSAGCDDATIVTRDGATRLVFDRQASSLEEALRSASDALRTAGIQVDHAELDPAIASVG